MCIGLARFEISDDGERDTRSDRDGTPNPAHLSLNRRLANNGAMIPLFQRAPEKQVENGEKNVSNEIEHEPDGVYVVSEPA